MNWQIDAGIDFIVACGSTGEAATLEEEEWLRAVRIVIEAAARPRSGLGRLHTQLHPHPASPGNNAAPGSRRRCRAFRQSLLQQAHAGRPVPALPCPGKSGRSHPRLPLQRARPYRREPRPADVVRLAEAAPNIQAIKEASGKLPQIAELVHTLPSTFKVFSGDDNLALAAIGVGAQGLISVASNEIPGEMARMIGAALHDEWADARELERRYGRLFEANFWESNPGPVKTCSQLDGSRIRHCAVCR